MIRVNDAVAPRQGEYANLITITGGDAYTIRVYEVAARPVAGYPTAP